MERSGCVRLLLLVFFLVFDLSVRPSVHPSTHTLCIFMNPYGYKKINKSQFCVARWLVGNCMVTGLWIQISAHTVWLRVRGRTLPALQWPVWPFCHENHSAAEGKAQAFLSLTFLTCKITPTLRLLWELKKKKYRKKPSNMYPVGEGSASPTSNAHLSCLLRGLLFLGTVLFEIANWFNKLSF